MLDGMVAMMEMVHPELPRLSRQGRHMRRCGQAYRACGATRPYLVVHMNSNNTIPGDGGMKAWSGRGPVS